mgnify:CR=1 FL=1
MDHPRSRGVYRLRTKMREIMPGSSPLARGLRPGAGGVVGVDGIIPARAGFTGRVRRTGGCNQDHPRSRGVYKLLPLILTPGRGSSPLARGLPHVGINSASGSRIIPARAGFTAYNIAGNNIATDHPRSRGVYYPQSTDMVDRNGSSPLARGLLIRVEIKYCQAGIIPARAGFTSQYQTMRSQK